MPARFSGECIVVKFLALCGPVLFPIWVFQVLLGYLEALRHLILGLFGRSIVVVSDPEIK